jgi:NADH-quinone oxidoreductase subunit C
MINPQELFDLLKQQFAEAVIEIDSETPTEPIISCDPLKIHEISDFLRTDKHLLFDSLMNLSGVDDANGEKIVAEDESYTIEGGTLSVYYHLDSTSQNHKATLKVSAPRENPEVESVENIWKGADWHEREAYDMYGIKFLNHPNLIRILMPYDWDAGYPLRKDYKNPEYYQGMKVPY